MKRILGIVLAAIMVMSLVACGNSGSSSGSNGNVATPTIGDNNSQSAASADDQITKPGDSVKKTKYIFNFQKAKSYDKITGDNKYLVDEPDAGNEYVVCFFEVTNVSDEDDFVNPLYIDAYADDTSVNTTTILNKVDGYERLSGDLAAGKKTKGTFAFQVPKGWKKLEFTYKDGYAKDADKYKFEVTPDTLSN